MKRKTKIDKPRLSQPVAQPVLQTQPQPLFDRLQTWANWAGVIGLFVATISLWLTYRLGATANELARRSFELSQKDTMQDRQLEELKKLFETAQAQLLVQNQQLNGINAQLGTINKHYDLAAHNTGYTQLANFYKLREAMQKIDAITPPEGVAFMKTMGRGERIAVIDAIGAIIKGELENTYLTARPDALKKWVDMESRCKTAKHYILSLREGKVNFIDNSGQHIVENPEEQRQLEDEQFGFFVDRLFDLSWYNMLEIVWKEERYMRGRQ